MVAQHWAGAAFWSLCLFRARVEMFFGLGGMLHWAAGEQARPGGLHGGRLDGVPTALACTQTATRLNQQF